MKKFYIYHFNHKINFVNFDFQKKIFQLISLTDEKINKFKYKNLPNLDRRNKTCKFPNILRRPQQSNCADILCILLKYLPDLLDPLAAHTFSRI